jgi:hypothetical protein
MRSFKGSFNRFEVLSKAALGFISLLLALFLILIGDKFLNDVAKIYREPIREKYTNIDEIKKYETPIKELYGEIEKYNSEKDRINKALYKSRSNYQIEKDSFNSWIEARKTMGSPAEDLEIKTRARQLDEYRRIEKEWRNELEKVDALILPYQKQISELNSKKSEAEESALNKYNADLKSYNIKSFFVRLLIVTPFIIISLVMVIKYRRVKYFPLFSGFILFSLYAFFFGLVPYLPDFGGYIRYTVGVILTVFLGIYIIRQINILAAKKKKELEESSKDRSKKIRQDTALKAYKSHCCPSCEKDFILNRWSSTSVTQTYLSTEADAPMFCRHCGIELFILCPKCSEKNFAHFPFCSRCGSSLISKE